MSLTFVIYSLYQKEYQKLFILTQKCCFISYQSKQQLQRCQESRLFRQLYLYRKFYQLLKVPLMLIPQYQQLNSKVKPKMDSSILKQYPILEEVTLQVLEEIEYSEIILETLVKIPENKQLNIEIVLIDEILMLYLIEKTQSIPLAFLRLNFALKFRRIFQTKNYFERQVIGVQFLNDFHQSFTFQFVSRAVAQEWMLYLPKLINETQFQNNYRPIRKLGQGSSATVFEIARLDDGVRFAAKVFDKKKMKNNDFKIKSFLNEVQILRDIEHQNLPQLKGVYQAEDCYYVVMEKLHGGNLYQYLTNLKAPLSISEIKIIMRNILKGLAYLQECDIVHRDIKLENLMLRNRHNIQIVIVDFGLAVQSEDEDYYCLCGTPGFISPDIINLKKGQQLTPKSDIFSAGVILHILLTKRYLFSGKSAEEVMKNNMQMNFNLEEKQGYFKIQQGWLDLLKKMLEKDSKKRLSASQCLKHAVLYQYQQGQSQQQDPTSPLAAKLEFMF